MILTTIAVLVAPFLLAILANAKGRSLLMETLETIAATMLVLLLLGIVLGLPIGNIEFPVRAALSW